MLYVMIAFRIQRFLESTSTRDVVVVSYKQDDGDVNMTPRKSLNGLVGAYSTVVRSFSRTRRGNGMKLPVESSIKYHES